MGQIVGLDYQTITLKRMKGAIVTIPRADVLRIGEEFEIRKTVYSGRSSWVDVEQIPLDSKLHTRIIMKDGRKHEGKLIKATESGLTLLEHGERVEIAKNETARVYFDRLRPWSTSDEFRIREEFIFSFFDPKFWSYEMNTGPKIPVLLYDGSASEDNTTIKCNGMPS